MRKFKGSEAGRRLWHECVKVGIEARKLVLNHCELIRPFIPTTIKGKKWQDYDTEEIATNLEFFKFHPTDTWHKLKAMLMNNTSLTHVNSCLPRQVLA